MTPYKRYMLAWLRILIFGLLFIVLTVFASSWFSIAFFTVVFGANMFLKGIEYPRCGTPVTYQGRFRGFKVFGDFIRRNCQNCDYDLNS